LTRPSSLTFEHFDYAKEYKYPTVVLGRMKGGTRHKEKQAEILEGMNTHSKADEEFYLTADKVFSLAKRALEIFESSEVPEKRQLLSFLLQNCKLNGKNILYELNSPFDLLVQASNNPMWLNSSVQIGTQRR